jgi:hypothetical protein
MTEAQCIAIMATILRMRIGDYDSSDAIEDALAIYADVKSRLPEALAELISPLP